MGGPRAPEVVPEGHQRCANSNHVKPFESFGINPKSGERFKRCNDCLAKIRVLAKNTAGKARTEARKSNEEYKRKQRKYKETLRSTEEGKAHLGEINKKWYEAHGIEYHAEYRESESGKVAIQRGKDEWKKNPKSKIAARRSQETRRLKMKSDPGYKLRTNMLRRLERVIKKQRKSSKMLSKHIKWADTEGLRAHFSKQLAGDCTLESHGKDWVVAHRIPLCYFDHSVPAEVAKAWSPSNLGCMSWSENSKLGIKIDDTVCMEAGVEAFPEWWNGKLPSPEEKKALYSKVKRNVVPWE